MTSIEPPPPSGTRYDNDPIFEALVFGWATSDTSWNGELTTYAADDRNRLADLYEQYLAQSPDPGPVPGETTDALPHPGAYQATVEHMAEIIRRNVSLHPQHYRPSTEEAARALIADATQLAQR